MDAPTWIPPSPPAGPRPGPGSAPPAPPWPGPPAPPAGAERPRPRRAVLVGGIAAALAVVVALVVTLVALGDRDSGSAGGAPTAATSAISLAGQTYSVGGKNFDEQLVLCKISILLLRAHGATVNDRCNISGSATARSALTSGQIDLIWEYTGTGWITNLKQPSAIPDARRQYEAVRNADAANGLTWLSPTPFNNTYAIGTTRAFAQRNGLRTTSDFARFVNAGSPEATLCVESEFAVRPDGLPGLRRAYGITGNLTTSTLDTGAIYQATANGAPCRFGEVFTTDGRLPGLDLVTLVDDRTYFPFYNASPVVRTDALNRQPQLAGLLEDVSRRLDDATILGLNGQISSQGLDPAFVAENWLRREGLLS